MDKIKTFFGKIKLDNHKKRIYANFCTKWLKIIFRTLFILGMAYVLLYPIMYLLSNAFAGAEDRLNPTVVWIPQHWTLASFQAALDILDYWHALARTLQILVPSVILQVFSSLLVGYGFARFKFRGRELLFGLLIFTIIVPVQTYIIPLYVNYQYFWGLGKVVASIFGTDPSAFNLLDKPWTFYIPAAFGMGIRAGLYIFIFRQYFRGLPKELEEAALIDGCGPFKVFLKIMLPNARSSIITVTLFSIVWYWNDYYQASMFFNSNFPLSVTLTMIGEKLGNVTNMTGNEYELLRMHIIESGCLLVIIPLLIIYIITQKYFTEGIEKTGLVG